MMGDQSSLSRPGVVDDTSGARRLLERVARGDREAFHAFYDRYGARVMGVLRRRVTAAGVAAELVQDVFVAVWLGAGHYREQNGEPERWLLGIVHHKLQDYWRRRTRELIEHAGRSRRPDAARPDADDRLTIEEALARLSVDQQRVLELIYREGLTFAEAAQALCMPVGTVKSRVHAALSALRAFFEPTGRP
jgi:RNA polymerase sigma-70 factor (ECF subfamily)